MAARPAAPLATRAPAKINLTLRVVGRRADGFHDLDSLVAFAGIGDLVRLTPGPDLALTISGPFGAGLAAEPDNLILRATRALVARRPGLALGTFHLVKRLPLASGIGGGSADAAAALRLLARLNGLAPDNPALLEAAAATGADVPVCLAGRARRMSGVGDRLGPPLALPPLFAVLVNPGVALATATVFRELGLSPGEALSGPRGPHSEVPRSGVSKDAPDGAGAIWSILRVAVPGGTAPQDEGSCRTTAPIEGLIASRNDLEAPARRLVPMLDEVLARLAARPGCHVARMSGSGATCFGLFATCRESAAAARALRDERPEWWVKATVLR